ncbi:AraC family transcriptional regulator [[Clostridium] innocuum]|uniref:AraC family transcriptional regulator n=1 Tax=Clostridium innocuum TaxID=1522 RepID=UPI002147F839|nr:AraC family transcriptional regulator [[Clostridium] innocuum]MCR0272739.1 AraC family transcriptional regulator [[Clostridium] innocuum]
MQAWEAIQKTLDYMEEHYEEALTIEQLSSIAHLSRFYYQRLFYRLTGYTVSEYLRSVRLKMAAGLLKADNGKIMDIAMQCGFSSHSTLTRAFRQCYGMSPAEYRASSDIHLDHVIKPELRMQYTLVDEGVPLICDDMVLEIQRRVQKEPLWFSGYTKEDESAKIAQPKENTLVALWDRLEQDDVLQHAALDEGNDILTPSQTPGAFTYMAAVHTAEPVKGYTAFEMPVGTYAVCEYEAESFEDLVQKALYKASAYLFEVWLPRHGYACDAFLIQRYIRPKQEDCRLQLWVKISDSLTL